MQAQDVSMMQTTSSDGSADTEEEVRKEKSSSHAVKG